VELSHFGMLTTQLMCEEVDDAFCSNVMTKSCSFMMNGLNQILGRLLAFCFSFIPDTSPISSWQALFMTYGIMTVFGAHLLAGGCQTLL
jgi:hypothetical protein